MTKQFYTVLVLFLISFLFSNQPLKSQKLALPEKNIAQIGSISIPVDEFQQRYQDYLISSGIKDNIVIRRAILNNMINEILLNNYDDNSAIESNPEFIKESRWIEKQTILAFLKDREIYAKIDVTDQEIRDAFHKSQEKIAARHLFAVTEEEANSLYQLLQTGADFYQLAKQVFTDSILADNGGYLGYFSWGDMDPEFEDAAYSLKTGQISAPVKTRYGFSIIKLEDRIPQPLITEDEFLRKKAHMERVVKIRKKKPAEWEFINSVYDQKKVVIDEKMLGLIYDNFGYSDANKAEKNEVIDYSSILLKYGEKAYSAGEILQRLNDIPFYHRDKITSIENLKTVLKGLVLQDLLFDIAVKKRYDRDAEVLSTLKKYKGNLFLKYKRLEISNNANFPDSVISKFYNDNLVYFMTSPKISIQEIIVNDSTTAADLITRIGKGEDFGSLAGQYSLREWSASNKGIIELSEIEKFGQLKDVLWNSPLGTIVGPVRIQNYLGIFRVIEKVDGRPKEYSDVRDDALRLLKKEKSKEIVEAHINKIKSKTSITINEKLLATAGVESGL